MSPSLARSFAPMALHLGNLIEARMEELGMPKSTLAQRIKKDRSTLDRYIDGNTIDTVTLRKICEVLERNFFRVLADDLDKAQPKLRLVKDPEVPYVATPRPMTTVRVDVDVSDPVQQDMVLDFADKLRRVQERKLDK